MGGDGGTLNNSRREHVRLRRAAGAASRADSDAAAKAAGDRASVRLCAASRQPLEAPVVVDRLGQLFNRGALVAALLARGPARDGPLAHIRALARDTAALAAVPAVCAATNDPVVDGGRFAVGWACGCLVSCAAVLAVRGGSRSAALLASGPHAAASRSVHTQPAPCIACGATTELVRIGLPLESREAIRTRILLEQAERAREKKQTRARKRKAAATPSGDDSREPQRSRITDKLKDSVEAGHAVAQAEELTRSGQLASHTLKSGGHTDVDETSQQTSEQSAVYKSLFTSD